MGNEAVNTVIAWAALLVGLAVIALVVVLWARRRHVALKDVAPATLTVVAFYVAAWISYAGPWWTWPFDPLFAFLGVVGPAWMAVLWLRRAGKQRDAST